MVYNYNPEWERAQATAVMNPSSSPSVIDTYEGILCTVTEEIPPEYELVFHHEYPRGKTYVGKAEECHTDITIPLPEQLFPDVWVVDKIADTFADKVEEQGAEMLGLKIYQDITPLWTTRYKVIATATASPVPWAIIIPIVLAIVLVVAFIFLIREVKTIDWGKPAEAVLPILFIVAAGVIALGWGIMVTRKKK